MKRIAFVVLVLLPAIAWEETPVVEIDRARLDRIRSTQMPAIDQPVLFNTPQADALLAAVEVFPPDNACNIPVDDWPVANNSVAMIELIGRTKPLRGNTDMAFVLVPPDQTSSIV